MHGLRNPAIDKLTRPSYWQSPNSTRVTVEQPHYQDYQQTRQSNPYNDYCNVLSGCSEKIQLQIAQDPHFLERYAVCETLIKQFLFPRIIPEVLQTAEGRIAFEELLVCTQSLKNHYTQEAAQEQKAVVDQAQKIQEQEQQIFALATELKRMKGYVEEILTQKTEPPMQLPVQVDVKEGIN